MLGHLGFGRISAGFVAHPLAQGTGETRDRRVGPDQGHRQRDAEAVLRACCAIPAPSASPGRATPSPGRGRAGRSSAAPPGSRRRSRMRAGAGVHRVRAASSSARIRPPPRALDRRRVAQLGEQRRSLRRGEGLEPLPGIETEHAGAATGRRPSTSCMAASPCSRGDHRETQIGEELGAPDLGPRAPVDSDRGQAPRSPVGDQAIDPASSRPHRRPVRVSREVRRPRRRSATSPGRGRRWPDAATSCRRPSGRTPAPPRIRDMLSTISSARTVALCSTPAGRSPASSTAATRRAAVPGSAISPVITSTRLPAAFISAIAAATSALGAERPLRTTMSRALLRPATARRRNRARPCRPPRCSRRHGRTSGCGGGGATASNAAVGRYRDDDLADVGSGGHQPECVDGVVEAELGDGKQLQFTVAARARGCLEGADRTAAAAAADSSRGRPPRKKRSSPARPTPAGHRRRRPFCRVRRIGPPGASISTPRRIASPDNEFRMTSTP